MRFPPNWVMELVMVTALGLAVVVLIFALQGPGGARTDVTIERGGVAQMLRSRDGPLAAGGMVLRR
jgi:hypothetical protein